MKVLNIFLILVVGAVANPWKREVEETIAPIKDDLSFMALIRLRDIHDNEYQLWGVILTENWILSSFHYSQLKTYNFSVAIYADLLNSTSSVYEIDSIVEQESAKNNSTPYTPFALIKLKHPIKFENLSKPIPLAGPNYELKGNEEVKVHYLMSILPNDFSSPLEYFNASLVNVTMDENIYKSQFNSCRASNKANEIDGIDCHPAILKGTLVGTLISFGELCDYQPFLKISSIYDWILKHVPELKEEKRTSPVEKTATATTTTISSTEGKENVIKTFVKSLFESHQTKIADLMYFNNLSIIYINGIPNE